MCQINLPGSGHATPVAQWVPFTNAEFVRTLERALELLHTRVKTQPVCNAAFASLPGGRTLEEIVEDAGVWISLDPEPTRDDFAARENNDIALTSHALSMGRWITAATLLRELARLNGAPAASGHPVERCLVSCLFRSSQEVPLTEIPQAF